MEKLVVLTCLLISALSVDLAAQCHTKQAVSSPSFFQQDPSAKAALIAAADESITLHVDDRGNKYYVREYINPWSGEKGYHLLEFDEELEAFVDRQDYAYQGGEHEEEQKVNPNCEKVKQDSLRLDESKVLPGTPVPPVKQPRRSSRVKLASLQF